MAKKSEQASKYMNGHCPVCGADDPVKHISGEPLHAVMQNGPAGKVQRTFLQLICNVCHAIYVEEVLVGAHGGPHDLSQTDLAVIANRAPVERRIHHDDWTRKEA